jgi:hypothetical protein
MDEERNRALTLAHEAESVHYSSPELVVKRAEVYLEFLRNPNRSMVWAEELKVEVVRPADGSWMGQ